MQELWLDKISKIKPEIEVEPATVYLERASFYAEFGKIICISGGFFTGLSETTNTGQPAKHYQLRLKAFAGDDEAIILREFFKVVEKMQTRQGFKFVGHNIQEFDIPYICRRAVILGIPLPDALQLYGKKPWEVPVVDTLHLWRFGDYKHYTSLQLLTTVLDIPSPKEDLQGSEVARVYWEDHDLERIARYCQRDVVAVAQLLLRFQHKPLLQEGDIQYV